MTAPAVLVTGGTGKTGSRLVQLLTQRGLPVKMASRSGGGAGPVERVVFDWSDETTFAPALDGVDRLYLVAPPGIADPYPAMAALFERALARGIGRFVLLSASSLPEGGPAMGLVHRLLRQRAPEWAVLRPTWFMQNFSEQQHLPTIRDEGRIYSATAEGRVAFVDAMDIASVALRALTDPEPHNADHIITGPEPLSFGQVAEIISATIGRPVRHVQLTEAALAVRFAGLGMPEDFAQMLAGMETAIAHGSEDRTTDTVARITGAAPRDFASFAKAAAGAWLTA